MLTNDYKASVGKYPTGVAVISTRHQGQLYGFTANSFTSVSLEPPIISFCLSKKAGSLRAFRDCNYFAINILASDQAAISSHFASHIADKFADIPHQISKVSDCPLIDGILSYVECKKADIFDVGDHFIFTGKVVAVKIYNDEKSPLIYYARSYGTVKVTRAGIARDS